MFIHHTMYAVVNNEDNSEDCYEFISDARKQLVRLVEAGIDAQMFPTKTIPGRSH
jgi:hypothetical protein